MPLPECPGNGLVIYKQFTEDELARLKPLIESPAYQALRSDTSYYRTAWLARALDGTKPLESAWLILQASWQADEAPQLKTRYQHEFVQAMESVPASPADMDWLSLQARTVNALRELGEFDRATTLLKSLLDSAPSAGDAQRRSWLGYLRKMEVLLARSDASSEPLDMIPTRVAAAKCIQMKEAATNEPHCGSGAVKEQIEYSRKMKSMLEQSH